MIHGGIDGFHELSLTSDVQITLTAAKAGSVFFRRICTSLVNQCKYGASLCARLCFYLITKPHCTQIVLHHPIIEAGRMFLSL